MQQKMRQKLFPNMSFSEIANSEKTKDRNILIRDANKSTRLVKHSCYACAKLGLPACKTRLGEYLGRPFIFSKIKKGCFQR